MKTRQLRLRLYLLNSFLIIVITWFVVINPIPTDICEKKSHRVWEAPKSYDVWGEIIQLIHFIVDSYATPLFKILNSKKFSNLVIHIICSKCQILLRNIWPSYTNWGKASPRILMFVICIISFTDHIQDTIFSYKITFPIPDSHYIQYINITYS